MKKILFILIFLFFLLFSLEPSDQKTITNPPKPLKSKNAGRVVHLKEIWRIDDSSGKFFLKYPRLIKISPAGEVFFMDDKEFLKFGKNGRFIKNLQKPGAGPGELDQISNYFLKQKEILIYCRQPFKKVRINYSGDLIGESRVNRMPQVITLFNNNVYFLDFAIRDLVNQNSGIINLKLQLKVLRPDSKITSTDLVFSQEGYLEKSADQDGRRMVRLRYLGAAVFTPDDQGHLFVSCSRRYSVSRIDLKTGQREFKFNRPYDPVSYEKTPEQRARRGFIYPLKYYSDINNMIFHNARLWVFTSTMDKARGWLVDVFNPDGQYRDSFYLRLPKLTKYAQDFTPNRKPITIHENFIYTVEPDDDENPTVVKYQIIDPG